MNKKIEIKDKDTIKGLIEIKSRYTHKKLSSEFIEVIFQYSKENVKWEGSIPVEYRGINLLKCLKKKSESDFLKYFFEACNPQKLKKWVDEERKKWEKRKAPETSKIMLELLSKYDRWLCVKCNDVIKNNPNWARRVQQLRDEGYLISIKINQNCKNCKKINKATKVKTTFLKIIPVKIEDLIHKYQIFTREESKKIKKVLGNIDAYEGKKITNYLHIDHKFPEIRWDENYSKELKKLNILTLSENKIKELFQLIDNRANEMKREACRKCFQTGKRGYPFGIKFFYKGDSKWPKYIPKKGKEAIKGCEGCGWYDLEAWRRALNELIKKWNQS